MSTWSELLLEAEVLDRELEEKSGVIDEVMEKRRDELLARIPQKVDGITYWVQKQQNDIDFLKARVSELQEVIKSKEERRKAVEAYVKNTMVQFGVKKLTGNFSELSVRPSNKKLITKDEEIPDTFWKVVVDKVIDKDAIREALEAGEQVPGAHFEDSWALHKNAAKGRPK